ncbi:hypothetical protein ACG0Z6_06655 [Roseateles sp. BYS180W]|uniref:SGNH hydrolase-type esterase domain-containing protein n=1 Tax=Roseateles rivi TaxID=3299028 RepID=A0ABW7FUD7_9BURK
MDQLACFTPEDLSKDPAPDWSSYRWKLLAHGDDWVAAPDGHSAQGSHLLQDMQFSQATALLNCARAQAPALSHVVDWALDAQFRQLLCAPDAPTWDGLLLSLGGHDLLHAAQTTAVDASGAAVDLQHRLLRTQSEWGAPSQGVARYFSEPGWSTFADYLRTNVQHLLSLRDQGPSAGKPVFVHCYAVPLPRPAGNGTGGPWLLPTFKAYAIPPGDWLALARLMVMHLAQLLKAMAADSANYPGLFVFDSTAVPLALPAAGSSGSSGDWHDEIHPNHSGCFKLGRAWAEHVDIVLQNGGRAPEAPTSGKSRARR